MTHPLPRRRGSAAVVTVGSPDGPERLGVLTSPTKLQTPMITSGPESRIPEVEVEFKSTSSTSTVVELSTGHEPSSTISDRPVTHRGLSCSSSTFEKPALGSQSSVTQKRAPFKPEPGRLIQFSIWFSPYRRLFLICVLVNTLGLALVVGQVWSYPSKHLTTFVLGNMVSSVLFRNEYALRLLYWVTIKLLAKWSPLRLRLAIVGLLYHIGGLHSGCGTASVMWLGLALSRHFQHRKVYHSSILVFLSFTSISVFITCLSALPAFRQRFHNTFECLHRFTGWFGILSTTILILLSAFWDVNEQTWKVNPADFLKSEDFWLILLIACLSTTPWITVARRPVEVVSPTEKISVMRFTGGTTSGLLTRLSRGGLQEWHIFGTISQGKQASYHYVVAAVQGDFTRSLNTEKPAQLFTRRWKVCGLPYLSRMFSRGLAICTGSGIGAVGSTCLQNKNWFLVWIGANLEDSYGPELMNLLRGNIEINRRIFWDTRGPLGRPDMMDILDSVYLSWEAEVVLFFGSPAVNKEVLHNSEMRGIPVFGSIWDA